MYIEVQGSTSNSLVNRCNTNDAKVLDLSVKFYYEKLHACVKVLFMEINKVFYRVNFINFSISSNYPVK